MSYSSVALTKHPATIEGRVYVVLMPPEGLGSTTIEVLMPLEGLGSTTIMDGGMAAGRKAWHYRSI